MKVVKSGSVDQWIRRSEKKVTSLQVNKLTRGTSGQVLKLKGKTLVVVDWANIYGWRHEPGYATSIEKIKQQLDLYKEIVEKRVYFGEDDHPKSVEFLKKVQSLGFVLVSKPVKYQNGVRKCNFDIEIAVDCLVDLAKYESFVFMSGDGDFAYLYEHLLKLGKQVVVIFGRNSLGRELHEIKGLFLLDFRIFGKKYPPKQVRGPRLVSLSRKLKEKSSKFKPKIKNRGYFDTKIK